MFAAALLALGSVALAQGSYGERFDVAWRLVDERYWRIERLEVDWDAMRERYRPQAIEAVDDEGFYAVLTEMFDRLGDEHSVFVSPAKVEEIRQAYGDLPCLGVFGQAGTAEGARVGAEIGGEAGGIADGNVRYELLVGDIGYIRLPDLATPGVAVSVRNAVRALSGRGARAWILDLRGNPGGRLVEMMQVAGIFTDGFLWRTLTNWTLPLPYPALGSTATDLPLVVLVDGQVHSAAEGLAGALQQTSRAVVIGERSAGNVEAVLPFCLRDGSQAWIATGVLAPIGGPTWEGRGVEPDVLAPSEDALERALAFLESR